MADTFLSERKIGLLVWKLAIFWQNNLRQILVSYKISLNEYLILETLANLNLRKLSTSQIHISSFSEIDVSVVSISLKSLEKKNFIKKKDDNDNRKKIIEMLPKGRALYDELSPKINLAENNIFNKLKDEKLNFTNSLKFLLNKKIRIKLDKRI